jgi:AraC-like DNA-binding protein
VLFGGVFAIVLALALLLKPKRRTHEWLLIAYLGTVAVWDLLGGSLLLHGADAFGFNVYAVTIPASFASIPLFYLFFRSIIDNSRRLSGRDAWHAVLPVLSAFLIAPSLRHPMYLYPASGLALSSMKATEVVPAATLVASGFVCIAYFAKLLFDCFRLLRGSDGAARSVLVPATCVILVLFLCIVAWTVDHIHPIGSLPFIYATHSLVLIAVFLFSVRFPDYQRIMGEEGERARYARSSIGSLQTGPTLDRIEALMREKRLYADPALSLEILAERLDLTSHQLSEFFNARLGKSFHEFIDAYRLEEAKRLLVADRERKILDIAFDVGFNSSSAFYEAFKKETGTTPSTFRKARLIS